MAAAEYAKQNNLRLCVFTFTQSPKQNKNLLLLTEEEKQAQFELLGVNTCYNQLFSSFCQLLPAQFVQDMLMEEYNAKALFCGASFTFGSNKTGNIGLLTTLCNRNHLHLGIVPDVLYDNAPVSSTRIRAALALGEIEAVNAMLGRPYILRTHVVHGKGIGHTLGFPTINQSFPVNLQAPAYGVYITRTWVNNTTYPSVTGWGTRPTVGGTAPSCETFLPAFSGNLYGECPGVEFHKKLDDIIKFDDLAMLAQAVKNWVAAAQSYWACA